MWWRRVGWWPLALRLARGAALLALAGLCAEPALATTPAELVPPEVVPLPVVDVLALTPEMRKWVHGEVSESLPPTERLNLLVSRLQARDGAGMRYDAWYTASAAESFAARRFNCLSFSHLVVAMARELGLAAYYLEAHYRNRYDREGDLVLLSGHITVGWGEGLQGWAVEFGREARLNTSRVSRIDDRRALALHYSNLGASKLREGNPRGALSALASAVGVDPRAGAAWVNLGVALRRHGNTAGAEAAYRRAIAADGEMTPGYSNLYALLRASGRTKEATSLVADISRRTRDPWLLLAMGDECMTARDLAGAEKLYRRAHAKARSEAAPAAAIAAWALASSDEATARKWVRRAEDRDPWEPRLVTLRAALGLPPPPRPPPHPAGTAAANPSVAGTPVPRPR